MCPVNSFQGFDCRANRRERYAATSGRSPAPDARWILFAVVNGQQIMVYHSKICLVSAWFCRNMPTYGNQLVHKLQPTQALTRLMLAPCDSFDCPSKYSVYHSDFHSCYEGWWSEGESARHVSKSWIAYRNRRKADRSSQDRSSVKRGQHPSSSSSCDRVDCSVADSCSPADDVHSRQVEPAS